MSDPSAPAAPAAPPPNGMPTLAAAPAAAPQVIVQPAPTPVPKAEGLPASVREELKAGRQATQQLQAAKAAQASAEASAKRHQENSVQDMHLYSLGFVDAEQRRFFRQNYRSATADQDKPPEFGKWLESVKASPLYAAQFAYVDQTAAKALSGATAETKLAAAMAIAEAEGDPDSKAAAIMAALKGEAAPAAVQTPQEQLAALLARMMGGEEGNQVPGNPNSGVIPSSPPKVWTRAMWEAEVRKAGGSLKRVPEHIRKSAMAQFPFKS